MVVGVAPLVGSLAFAAWTRFQDHEHAVTDWIAVHLGLDAVATEWRAPLPGNTTLDSLKLLDPESQQLLATCAGIRHRRGAGGHAVHIQTAYVSDGQVAVFWQLLDRQLLRQRRLTTMPLRVHIDRLVLRADGAENELRDVRLECRQRNTTALASITLRSSRMSADQRSVRIRWERRLDTQQPVTAIEVTSRDQAVDLCLLTGWESLARLGSSVTFRGMLSLESSTQPGAAAAWSGSIAGNLGGVKLSAVTQHLPHRASGVAEIEIREARFVNGRVDSLDATAVVAGGMASQSWMSATSLLGLETSQNAIQLASAQDRFQFDRLACDLRVNEQGLKIVGACDHRGTLLLFGESPLMRAASHAPIRFEHVIEALTDLPLQRALMTPVGVGLWQHLPLAETAQPPE